MEEELVKSAEDILEILGHKDNIKSVISCTTRLRVSLKEPKRVNVGLFKRVHGVLGIVEIKDQFQIIIELSNARELINKFMEVYEMR